MSPVVGTIIAAIGYVLAIYGGWRLYQNAAPDIGIGRIPVISGGESVNFFERQKQEIADRQRGNQFGFGFLTFGSFLQLVGTLISGFAA